MGVPEEISSALPVTPHSSYLHQPIPPTDRLVECFNQTLKSMLRKAATDEGKYWDKLVPYLLFAYREVPQASMGFSPLNFFMDEMCVGR